VFGRMVGDQRQAGIFAVMGYCSGGVAIAYWGERGQPGFAHSMSPAPSVLQAAGTWRARRSASLANSRCSRHYDRRFVRSVNNMHDSLMPLAGAVPLVNIMLARSSSAVSLRPLWMLLFAILAVFIAGLMVGRTPEYLARRSRPRNQDGDAPILILPLSILGFTGSLRGAERARRPANQGPHGFSEILYAYTSARNNGSAFAASPPTRCFTT